MASITGQRRDETERRLVELWSEEEEEDSKMRSTKIPIDRSMLLRWNVIRAGTLLEEREVERWRKFTTKLNSLLVRILPKVTQEEQLKLSELQRWDIKESLVVAAMEGLVEDNLQEVLQIDYRFTRRTEEVVRTVTHKNTRLSLIHSIFLLSPTIASRDSPTTLIIQSLNPPKVIDPLLPLNNNVLDPPPLLHNHNLISRITSDRTLFPIVCLRTGSTCQRTSESTAMDLDRLWERSKVPMEEILPPPTLRLRVPREEIPPNLFPRLRRTSSITRILTVQPHPTALIRYLSSIVSSFSGQHSNAQQVPKASSHRFNGSGRRSRTPIRLAKAVWKVRRI
jgi:hypothetical protein